MSERTSEYKTAAELGAMTVDQRMDYLLDQWSMSRPSIVGVLKRNEKGVWWIEDVRDPAGRSLAYPISDRRLDCNAAYLGSNSVTIQVHLQNRHLTM